MTPDDEVKVAMRSFVRTYLPWFKLMIACDKAHKPKFNPSPKLISWFISDCDRSYIEPYEQLPHNVYFGIEFMIDY